MKKTVLRNYARLIAKTGVNIEKGQEVVIQAGLDQPEFIKTLVGECSPWSVLMGTHGQEGCI